MDGIPVSFPVIHVIGLDILSLDVMVLFTVVVDVVLDAVVDVGVLVEVLGGKRF